MADDIEGGSTLSEAMGKYGRCFDRLFVNMVAAGEAGGVLDLILARVADFMEKAERLKARVKGAMIYPVVVLTAAFLASCMGLMTFVIPQFRVGAQGDGRRQAEPRDDHRARHQRLDRQGLSAGPGWPACPSPMIFLLKFLRRFRPGRVVLDTIQLRLPVLGQLSSKVSITRWTRTLGTLIGAGVPILDAINITRETAGNEVYANMLGGVHNAIRQGDTFANPLRLSKTVDLLVANMVDVGEETGDLDKMLLKMADQYDEQVDVLVGGLMSLLEPIMIIVLGSIVMRDRVGRVPADDPGDHQPELSRRLIEIDFLQDRRSKLSCICKRRRP